MLTNSLLRVVIPMMVWLVNLASAEIYKQAIIKAEEQPLPLAPNEKTMAECDQHISICGVVDEVKIVRSPISTIYETQNFTTTVEKTMPTQTSTIVKVKVVTVNNQTEGHCRNTTTIPDLKPAIITVNVTVEHVNEIVPVTNLTVTTYSTVTAKSIEQCFVKNTALPAPPPEVNRGEKRGRSMFEYPDCLDYGLCGDRGPDDPPPSDLERMELYEAYEQRRKRARDQAREENEREGKEREKREHQDKELKDVTEDIHHDTYNAQLPPFQFQ